MPTCQPARWTHNADVVAQVAKTAYTHILRIMGVFCACCQWWIGYLLLTRGDLHQIAAPSNAKRMVMMKLEHLTLMVKVQSDAGAVQFWLCCLQADAVPLCRIYSSSPYWQSAACFPATAQTPWLDDADLLGLRTSLFLLGVRDVDAAIHVLSQQARQVWARCVHVQAA